MDNASGDLVGNAQGLALQALEHAAQSVRDLCAQVDPGHVPMIHYLRRLAKRIDNIRTELDVRCEEESGGR